MENRAHALAAGLFAILLLAGVGVSVWWLAGSREVTRDVMLVATSRVDGLGIQSQVRFRGLRVGKVTSIDIEDAPPHRIEVVARIAASVPLSTATRAELNTMGVTGLAYVQLDESAILAQPLPHGPEGMPILALAPSKVEEFSDSATRLTQRMSDLAHKLNLLLSETNLAKLDRTLGHLENISAGMEKSVGEAPKLVAELHRALDEENLTNLKSTLVNLEKASGAATPLLADARRTLARLDSLAGRLDEFSSDTGGELQASTLPKLNALVRDVSANSRALSAMLEEMRRSPQALVWGRPAPAPGPGEPGYEGRK